MNVLATGAAGFIGSNLSRRLVADGHTVIVIDNFQTARRDLVEPADGITLVEGSIADLDDLRSAFDHAPVDVVVHAAASYKDPDAWEEDIATNVLGTANVVKETQARGIERLIYFQTALCYGNRPLEQPVTLDHPLRPESSYAISKTGGEEYIRLSGLDFVSFRLANIYGPGNLSGPIPTFYMRLAEGKSCFAVDTRRDFVFVDDLLDVVVAAIEKGTGHGFYHVSSGTDHSIKELYDAVAAAMGRDDECEEQERGADDAATILLDPSRTNADFGWEAKTPLAGGVRETVRWYEQHGVQETYTHLRLRD